MTEGLREMLLIWAAASLVVLTAMLSDLLAGLWKAKLRGDKRTSYALKRSVYKFLTYEGAIIVSGCIDMLMHFARLFLLIGVEVLENVPVVALLVGIFLCVVELLSIREKADEKTHKTMKKVEDMAGHFSEKAADRFLDLIFDRLKERLDKDK